MPTPSEVKSEALPENANMRAAQTPVREIMSRDVVCVRSDFGVTTAAELFLARGISGAPVVDPDGMPIGLISKTDLVREFLDRDHRGDGESAQKTTKEIMTPLVFAVSEDAPIAQASALMASQHLHRLPVVSKEGAVVGLVSSLDILRWVAKENDYLLPRG